MKYLYHGTSSKFIKDILENGLGRMSFVGKYGELRHYMSKYINPEILTDEFFDKYIQFIKSGNVSSVGLRTSQANKGDGPFATQFTGGHMYGPAPDYAKATTAWGAGEYEDGIVKYLNRLNEIAKNPETSVPEREFVNIMIDNAKPQFKSLDGGVKFYTKHPDDKDLPVMIKFKIPDSYMSNEDYNDDIRIKHAIKPEDIIGIAFIPPFYFDTMFISDDNVPVLDFMPKQEFLAELDKRQKQPIKYEDQIIRDNYDQTLKQTITYLDYNLVCVQKFSDNQIHRAYFYMRDGNKNLGLIAEKQYFDGKPRKCIFANKYGSNHIGGEVKYTDGKPTHWDEIHDEEMPKNFSSKQIREFIVNYEYHPDPMPKTVQKMSDRLQDWNLAIKRLHRIEQIRNNTGKEVEMDLVKKYKKHLDNKAKN